MRQIKAAIDNNNLIAGINKAPVVDNQTDLLQKGKLAKTLGGDSKDLDNLADRLRETYQTHQRKCLKLSTRSHKLLGSKARKIDAEHSKIRHINALIERGYSLGDLTENSYNRMNFNPNTMSYWFPSLKKSVDQQSYFKVPQTKILRMPIEIAQYLRHDFQTETNEISRKKLNNILFNAFELDESKEYFVKLGNFSSKFEFKNAHVDDPKAIGDYFNVVTNFAMTLGAHLTNELVVREWIPDTENRPTMYDGMPLRTEFRTFVDLDTKTIIDILPYWNNKKVEKELQIQAHTHINDSFTNQNFSAFKQAEKVLNLDFEQFHTDIACKLQPIVDNMNLTGVWSLDIMKSGDDFYIIDMATAHDSALFDLVNNESKILDFQKRKQMGLPAIMPDSVAWKFGKDRDAVLNASANNERYLETRNITDLKLETAHYLN